MHKLKRLFKRKRPSPTKNEDIKVKKARNECLNITVIDEAPRKNSKFSIKMQGILSKLNLVSKSNYDASALSAYRRAHER